MGPNKVISFFLTTVIASIKKLDPEIFLPLNPYIGKVILLDIDLLFSGTKRFYLLIEKNNIVVITPSHGQSVALTLTGKLFDLGRFGLDYLRLHAPSEQAEWINLLHLHHIQCVGDVTLLHAWQAVLKQMDLDWTALWSSIVGDKLAFPVAHFFKKSKQYANVIVNNSKHAIKEYVLYEKNCLVQTKEVEQWIEDIMTLKNDTERLEKNLNLLKTRTEKLT